MNKNRKLIVWLFRGGCATWAAAGVAQAQFTNWVAFCDYARGTNTAPNVLAFTLATAGPPTCGAFTNFLDGATLPAGVSVSGTRQSLRPAGSWARWGAKPHQFTETGHISHRCHG